MAACCLTSSSCPLAIAHEMNGNSTILVHAVLHFYHGKSDSRVYTGMELGLRTTGAPLSSFPTNNLLTLMKFILNAKLAHAFIINIWESRIVKNFDFGLQARVRIFLFRYTDRHYAQIIVHGRVKRAKVDHYC